MKYIMLEQGRIKASAGPGAVTQRPKWERRGGGMDIRTILLPSLEVGGPCVFPRKIFGILHCRR